MQFKHQELTELIIKAFYNVYNSLGYGFLEKVYENSMLIELKSLGLNCEKQKPISVFYKNLKHKNRHAVVTQAWLRFCV